MATKQKKNNQVGDYTLGDVIGKGAYGTVYRGLDTTTGEVVAIKELNKNKITKEELPGLMRELQLLKTLDDPNIVGYIRYEETETNIYFVLEYVEGGSINSFMKKFGGLSESLLQIYISEVLSGLTYLHSKEIIHRDIKGGNILITKEGQCKLADFGSCVNTTELMSQQAVGTPFWMAPELVQGQRATYASDIWSLGCTIIELLTGSPPYINLGPQGAMYRMTTDPHPPIPETSSPELRSFLLSCFQKDPKQRPSAKKLQLHPWLAPKEKTSRTMELGGSLNFNTASKMRGSLSSASLPTSKPAQITVPSSPPPLAGNNLQSVAGENNEKREKKKKFFSTISSTILPQWHNDEGVDARISNGQSKVTGNNHNNNNNNDTNNNHTKTSNNKIGRKISTMSKKSGATLKNLFGKPKGDFPTDVLSSSASSTSSSSSIKPLSPRSLTSPALLSTPSTPALSLSPSFFQDPKNLSPSSPTPPPEKPAISPRSIVFVEDNNGLSYSSSSSNITIKKTFLVEESPAEKKKKTRRKPRQDTIPTFFEENQNKESLWIQPGIRCKILPYPPSEENGPVPEADWKDGIILVPSDTLGSGFHLVAYLYSGVEQIVQPIQLRPRELPPTMSPTQQDPSEDSPSVG